MSIKQKDIKLLWGRAANRCAICRVELTQDKNAASSSYTIGEQAHIVGEKDEAARGKSIMPLEERNSYHNLILLCPNHHTEIDNNEEDWPIEKLHQNKSNHELWVTETLSETIDHVKLAKQAIISSIVDTAVTLCELDSWESWTGFAISADPQWALDKPEKVFLFNQKVLSAIWPEGFKELKNATITLAVLLDKALRTFMEHGTREKDMYWPDNFYKAGGYNPNYDRDVKLYNDWRLRCYKTIERSTKAANWFADIVRRDVNPMFFAEKGKFLITQGPFEDLSFRSMLFEFTAEEKLNYPDAAIDA